MNNFLFDVPTKIYFGRGEVRRTAEALNEQEASRVLVLYGSDRVKRSGLLEQATRDFKYFEMTAIELGGVKPNPRIDKVREGVELVRQNACDFILAVGGGSVFDSAKAIAAASYFDGDAWDLIKGKGKVEKSLPIGGILTLAATGSEMNTGCVISNPETKEKVPYMLDSNRPKFAILDPVNTFTVPPHQTAAGTADIFSHVLEQYFSPTKNTFIQDRMAEAILKTCLHFGPIAMKEPDHYDARAELMWAGTLALNGLLEKGKLGDWSVHPIEHEISAINDMTHGEGLAVLTPHWMNFVLDENTMDKFVNLALNVFGCRDSHIKLAVAKDAITKTQDFFASLGFTKKLRDFGITESDLPSIAEKAAGDGRLGNFKPLSKEDILTILKEAF